MITGWQSIPLMLGDKHVTDINGRYDLTYSRDKGWYLLAVIIDADGKPERIERDGSIKRPNGWMEMSNLARAIAASALHDFDLHRDAILEDCGLVGDAA